MEKHARFQLSTDSSALFQVFGVRNPAREPHGNVDGLLCSLVTREYLRVEGIQDVEVLVLSMQPATNQVLAGSSEAGLDGAWRLGRGGGAADLEVLLVPTHAVSLWIPHIRRHVAGT